MSQDLQEPFDFDTQHALKVITTLQSSLSELAKSINKAPSGTTHFSNIAFSRVKAGFGALEADLTPSFGLVHSLGWLYHVPIALGIVVELGWPELVSELTTANPCGGVSTRELEAHTGVPWSKISRLLRLLCGRGFFIEVKPDVFAHTRHSRALDSGLPYSEIVKDPIARFTKGSPLPALAHHWCGEVKTKSSVALFDVFKDDRTKKSFQPNETGFNKAYQSEMPFWAWMESVDDGARVKSFMNALSATVSAGNSPDHSLYPWQELGPNATIVDVGGGVGSAMVKVLPHAPNITKAIIQDRREVIDGGVQQFWDHVRQNDITKSFPSDRIAFQAIDFFKNQPVREANAYFLRFVLHDWSDDASITILKYLHDAAGSNSRLLIEDVVVDHACREVDAEKHVEGAYDLSQFPEPLPPNGGLAAEPDLNMDQHMMAMLNGQERTHRQLEAVAAQAGWKARKVYALGAGSLKISEFVKA